MPTDDPAQRAADDLHELRVLLYEDGWDSVGRPHARLRMRLRNLKAEAADLRRDLVAAREERNAWKASHDRLFDQWTANEPAVRYKTERDAAQAEVKRLATVLARSDRRALTDKLKARLAAADRLAEAVDVAIDHVALREVREPLRQSLSAWRSLQPKAEGE